MTGTAAQQDAFVASFEAFAKTRAGEPAWLAGLRHAALHRFADQGFPTTKHEDWRHTSVATIARTAFRLADDRDQQVSAGALKPLGVEAFPAHVVFVNGRFAPEWSTRALPEGLEVLSLAALIARDPRRLEPHVAQVMGRVHTVFADLNTAFFSDGAALFVKPGAVVAEPLLVAYLTSAGDGQPLVCHPRTLVVAGRGSQATLLESYGSPDGRVSLTNAVSEILLEDDAILDHSTLQQHGESAFHVASVAVRQSRGSHYTNHNVALGAALARTDLDAVLAAEGTECTLNGLFVGHDRQHLDTRTRIDHAAPHGTSRQLYKGVLDGQSRGVFTGRVVVHKDAQKTDAQQTNKNLLLSRDALVDSTPALEIHADDVKCKHGSTTGQLDPLALFYLRSRGIGEDAARSLLTYAFASDVVGRIKVPAFRAGLEAFLHRRLPSAPEEAIA
jgi:Fe-S cluster assembly protein SufD